MPSIRPTNLYLAKALYFGGFPPVHARTPRTHTPYAIYSMSDDRCVELSAVFRPNGCTESQKCVGYTEVRAREIVPRFELNTIKWTLPFRRSRRSLVCYERLVFANGRVLFAYTVDRNDVHSNAPIQTVFNNSSNACELNELRHRLRVLCRLLVLAVIGQQSESNCAVFRYDYNNSAAVLPSWFVERQKSLRSKNQKSILRGHGLSE